MKWLTMILAWVLLAIVNRVLYGADAIAWWHVLCYIPTFVLVVTSVKLPERSKE